MREIKFDVNGLPGCCMVGVPNAFYHNQDVKGKTVKDEEWFDALTWELNSRLLVFTNSSKENRGLVTPTTFARWLRRKGQEVAEIKYKHITLYTCALSNEFWKEYTNYKNKKEDAERRGANAA